MSAITIAGTQKRHHFQPITNCSLIVKQFSSSEVSTVKKVAESAQDLPDEEMLGYVTVNYDGDLWLVYIVERDTDLRQATVTFLQPKGPAGSFTYPSRPDILTVPFVDILLTTVNVTTTNARSYFVAKKEQDKTTKALQQKNDHR